MHPASRASFLSFVSGQETKTVGFFLGTKHMYRKKRFCLQGGVSVDEIIIINFAVKVPDCRNRRQ